MMAGESSAKAARRSMKSCEIQKMKKPAVVSLKWRRRNGGFHLHSDGHAGAADDRHAPRRQPRRRDGFGDQSGPLADLDSGRDVAKKRCAIDLDARAAISGGKLHARIGESFGGGIAALSRVT